MKRLFTARSFVAAAVALGAVVAASAAQARSEVFLSIGVPGAAYVQPAPVYVQPQPYYAQPQPYYDYAPSPVYYGQQRFVEYRGPHGDADRDGVPNIYDRDYRRNEWRNERRNERRNSHRFGPYGDLDHDGVPNRYDRFPQNPYRH